ncbi:hypothetical protein [Paraburkholderia sp. GAS334]|uniref:hypothetical protein n=1 Tax=Paraburkholderia sp. GAS334 TaxID=3035131 RepID=UPI003D21ADF3
MQSIAAYDFTSATVYSTDAGITWHDSANLATPGWTGVSDPVLTWDDSGNVFLVGAAFPGLAKVTMGASNDCEAECKKHADKHAPCKAFMKSWRTCADECRRALGG